MCTVFMYICVCICMCSLYIYIFEGVGILVYKRLFMLLKGSRDMITGLVVLFVSSALRKGKF